MYGYQPGYYMPSQPMGQLEQLRTNQQPMMPQPARPQNQMIWVQGESGAKSYMVAAGNSVPLWDSERQTIYIKSCDASGMPSMRVLDYVERTAPQPKPVAAAAPAVDYVTREEFNALSARIDAMNAKPAKASKKEAAPDEPTV